MSFLESFFFKPLRPFTCPFCWMEFFLPVDRFSRELKNLTNHQCSNPACLQKIPVDFLRHYGTSPIIHIPLIGWKGSGKSVFILKFLYALNEAEGKGLWKDYEVEPLNDKARNAMKEALSGRLKTNLPVPTPEGDKESHLFHLRNMGSWGSCMWVMRDVAGEVFQKFLIDVKDAPFVFRSRTNFLFLDLVGHLMEGGAVTAHREDGVPFDDLLQRYTSSLKEHSGWDPAKDVPRNLIVLISKASQISNLPQPLPTYITRDDTFAKPMDAARTPAYLDRLERNSKLLEDWLENDIPGGKGFLTHARVNRLNLKFCLISSLPSGVSAEPDGTILPVADVEPARMLDPLLWALHLSR